jgi:2,4-dienoyl-CoA reductase-like NADH-dependent reductase (Old Yellow Enzyme family)
MTSSDQVRADLGLASPLRLPNGSVLANRLAKAAMSEQLGSRVGAPTPELVRLYDSWARSGAGLLITGNVMIDRRSLGEPRNVVVDDERDLPALRRWAAAATAGGTVTLVQVNHPGRQIVAGTGARVVAPSEGRVELGPAFARARALEAHEITELVERFATTSRIVTEAGFDGVQLHAAHGYLVSQFLSPLTNRRTDAWGGDPERRRRFLLESLRAVRAAIGPDRVLSLKLNSADFQRGGFTEEESLAVIGLLADEGVDLLEISGGTYESPAMSDGGASASTRSREAFFLEFAEQVRAVSTVPLMVTGGFRSGTAMTDALTSGATDVIGLARPLALEPDLPRQLLADPVRTRSDFRLQRIGVKKLDAAADLWWTQHQIQRLGAGRAPDPSYGARRAVLDALLRDGLNTLRRRRG